MCPGSMRVCLPVYSWSLQAFSGVVLGVSIELEKEEEEEEDRPTVAHAHSYHTAAASAAAFYQDNNSRK